MTNEQSPSKDVADAVKEDVTAVPLAHHIQTVLITTGILSFGFMLGAHFMAADLLFGLRLPPLPARYQSVMNIGMFVAGGCLVTGFAISLRGGEPDE